MMSIFGKIFGDSNEKVIESLKPIVEGINLLEDGVQKLSDTELKNKTGEFKKRLQGSSDAKLEQEELEAILPEAFAVVREAARRTLNQRHFDAQLMGGIALHRGEIAEMKTGEGKTLVATLPAYLNAISGGGVHIVTVNDYLSRRDAAWMGQIYNALGLSVGCLNHEISYLYDPAHTEGDKERDILGSFKVVHEFLKPVSRREAYAADITYGTNNEFGFDYLRDNMVYAPAQMAQHGHNFAIVDEVDSILIDEARTPLIISAPDTESAELYKVFSKIVPRLKEKDDYTIDEKMKTALITEPGIEKIEQMLGIKDIYSEKGMKFVHHLEQALRAEALFHRDKDYVVKNGEVIIVDEFTGRLMPGRRWSDGLHQAIEAKEGAHVQQESRTLATITFQNYFRLYKKLSGMTGTAQTSAEEFHKVYNLEVVQIPTNKQMVRKDLADKVLQSENGKWKALIKEIKERHEKGQPVLVGTVSIGKNEKLSAMLGREGVAHKILNAKNHEEEGSIIAQAGRFGAVTVATNMAGRGVDIILGGNPPSFEEARRVSEVGGLLVIGTERHEARRIDDQLRGRSGRQGDPGESQFYVSLEDDLMRIFASDKIKNLMGRFGIPEEEPIENKMVSSAIESAQGKIEGFNFDQRKHLLDYDDVMNKQRTALYSRRKKLLFAKSEELEEEALNLLENVLSRIVIAHTAGSQDEWDKKAIEENILSLVNSNADQEELHKKISESSNAEELLDYLKNYIKASFLKKKEVVDGFAEALRIIMLQAIDTLWMEHLEAMEYMRSSVRLRAYGQKDPLVEYKNEGARMFKELEGHINVYIANLIFKIGIQQMAPHSHLPTINVRSSTFDKNGEIGRNDPCPCGSGKKYKKCHGK
ncbi:preprotein translocase subunit SecA [Candidatus Giovannonibacteria bacterium RIFCSPLOWO2_02_FULL_43_37]|uniref:Protein translocase subunit SecA n=2 Tax=Candidatus Giovannoniibacteriota TaxID=1752738 RepID=A0A1F5XVL1_9BACT|nr:MAG: preprotein translocase subunit SecA [Candidatus Giovannonibacteria bacterium RIFCSPHIGHO2_01_FULL_43_140]OGF70377.1 MAG: preprotein translocase subunit SecA [Candidatus Giovannonibacteria bacterium RIFCSPHIGHO2_02_FULL_44_51]OGF71371.1 MAG: preprotein translocase subunit SecA [Candidatus Giovannonibacteria bacterium RIFCSPHIGHO2_12_FULL_44_22]OGF86318.1 MAG: preprotein translocase subunit SecA [Candidatus Giovannonibacteria bacterium RIFCSPLOWO2_02_FULL_43_37]OGF91909.1 MAG: preprotein 